MDFDTEFDELAGLAYRTAYRIVGSSRDAEDIAQEAMIRGLVRWNKIAEHARPWVCRTAANLAIDLLRRRTRHSSWLRRRDHGSPDGGEYDATSDRVDLQRVLVTLSRRQREVLALRFVADLTEAEVARELGLSVATVKTHAKRALAALRADLTADEPVPSEEYDIV